MVQVQGTCPEKNGDSALQENLPHIANEAVDDANDKKKNTDNKILSIWKLQ